MNRCKWRSKCTGHLNVVVTDQAVISRNTESQLIGNLVYTDGKQVADGNNSCEIQASLGWIFCEELFKRVVSAFNGLLFSVNDQVVIYLYTVLFQRFPVAVYEMIGLYFLVYRGSHE